jgi:Fe-S-cluster-containing dehydrogenase component
MTGISRRQFLKLSVGAAGAAALAGRTPRPAWAASGVHPDRVPSMLIDISRCVGCGACQRACTEANGLNPSEEEKTRLNAEALTVVQRYDLEGGKTRWVKRQCMHCLDAACASACPVAALYQSEEGPITYRASRCLGCRYCMVSCPFDMPRFEWKDGLTPEIRKCMFCIGRQRNGDLPACASACPSGALKFGTRGALLQEAHTRIEANPRHYVNHVYGEHEAGGASMLYISDTPFELLGFRTDVTHKPLPTYTWQIMSKLPYVVGGLAVVLTGASTLTRKQRAMHDHEPDWTAGKEKPTEES